jgi:hypothetical protein
MEALALTQLRSGLLEGLVGDFNGILIYIYIYGYRINGGLMGY